jgi:perosamine synthetase
MLSQERIPLAQPHLSGLSRQYLMDAYDSGWISSNGPFNEQFELAFAEYLGVPYALSVANGTVALHLILAGLGIGPGDEVIVPSFTYVATANAVTYTGATPVLVDADADTWALSPPDVLAAISTRTRAIVVAHLYGQPASADLLAREFLDTGIPVIEDAAQGLGSQWRGQAVGSFGLAASFSFFGNKVLTTGEGGMVVTHDHALFEHMRILRGQGMDPNRRYWFGTVGFNYRMTNLQAAVGLGQMEGLSDQLATRSRIASDYEELFCELDVPLCRAPIREGETRANWLWTPLAEERGSEFRDALMNGLARGGVETRPTFIPLHLLPPHARDRCFPVAEDLGRRGISFPTFVGLGREDIRRVATLVKALI